MKTLHTKMPSIPVQVVAFNPTREFTINLCGETTLGSLRDVIESHIGGGRPIDRAWIAFEDKGKRLISFSHTEKDCDALQIRFLRCSSKVDSVVSVGIFRFSVE